MSNNHEERISDVENWKSGAEERIKTLFRMAGEANESLKESTLSMKELNHSVTVLTTQIAVLVAQNAARKDCPSPGSCLEMRPRLEALEKDRTAFVGSWKGVAFVVGCGVTLIGTVGAVSGIIKLFFWPKP
jgi:hypothetical protein